MVRDNDLHILVWVGAVVIQHAIEPRDGDLVLVFAT